MGVARSIVILIGAFAVGYPVYEWSRYVTFRADALFLFDLFPVFGIIAFVIMWLHVVGAPFKPWLNKMFDFQKFVNASSAIVLVSLFAHPLLLYLALYLQGGGSPYDFAPRGANYLITIAILAWIIFIGYDLAKIFKDSPFLSRNWKAVKLISTLALFLVLIHSLGLGRDLQADPLRTVWIFYGITAGIATIWTYLLKRE